MRHKYLITFALLFLSNICFSQTNKPENLTTITLQAIDSLKNEPLPYVTLNVIKKSTPNVSYKSFVSDDSGLFKFQLPSPEKYTFSFATFGKSTKKIDIDIPSQSAKDIGKILLSDSHQLAEVEVVANKILIKREIDRISYSMENDPDSKTSTLIDMIKKVPMLSIDNDQNIKLKGRTKFKILLDGKETTMSGEDLKNMLKATQANTVKEVQVITDPGVKYESDGLDGLINIVTQKNSKLGGFVVNLNSRFDSDGGYNAGISSQMKYGKLGVDASVSNNKFMRPMEHSSNQREAFNDVNNKYMNTDGENKFNGSSYYGSLRLNYEIDTLNLLSINGRINSYTGDSHLTSITTMMNASNTTLYKFESISTEKYNGNYSDFNINYQMTSPKNKDRMLTFSYQLTYTPYKNNNYTSTNNILNYPGYDNQNLLDTHFLNHNFQVDFTSPIKKVHTIELGTKYSQKISKSKSNYTILYPASVEKNDTTMVNNFRNEQDVFAAYFSYRYTSKKWSVRTGLRLENTNQKIEYPEHSEQNFNKSYFSIVPSVTIAYMINDNNTIKTNYRMGLWRPNIWYLNPYNISSDTLTVRVGNPNLKAEKFHNFSLGYDATVQKVVLGLNLSYIFSNNSINEISELKNNVTYNTFDNIGKEQHVGAWTNMSWSPNQKFQCSFNVGLDYTYYKTNGVITQRNEGVSYNGNMDVSYTTLQKIRLGANSYYSSPWVSTQGKGSSYFQYEFSVSRSFLSGDRLNVRLYSNKPFCKNSEYRNTTQTPTFRMENYSSYRASQLGISVSFRIGDMKVGIKEAQRGISNDESKGGSGRGNR